MKKSHKILGFVVLTLALATLFCGCTDTGTTTPATATPTATSAATVEETVVPVESKWMLWREGAGQTLNALGGYQSFSPTVEGRQFKELKIEVQSDNPVTVMFFTNSELNKFKDKMATNQGEFTPVSTYDNVNYQLLEQSCEDYLNMVLYNTSSKVAVVSQANVWNN